MSINNVAQRTVSTPTHTLAEDPQSPAMVLTPTPTPAQSSTVTVQETPRYTLGHLTKEQENLRALAGALRRLGTPVDGKPVTPQIISEVLNRRLLLPHRHATDTYTSGMPARQAHLITRLGYDVPSTADELIALAQTLEKKTAVHPLGNFGGGLSWPIPMSRSDQLKISLFLHSKNTGVAGLPLPIGIRGTLGYLLSGSSVTQEELQDDPVKVLHTLLESPKAIALGQALKKHLGGVSSDTSIYEYVLTAINVELDQESREHRIRNKVTEVDLLQPSSWGKLPSAVVDDLSRNLIVHHRATAHTAKFATHLLLSHEAPQFLVKDIPESVTCGSLLWTQLTLAVAKIEQVTPGRVPGMTYAQVLFAAEGLPEASKGVQTGALIDWGKANKFLEAKHDSRYTPTEIERTRTAFNQQQEKLKEASELIDTSIPNRKDMALEWLKARCQGAPDGAFDQKLFYLEERPLPVNRPKEMVPYSLRELTMEGIRFEGKRKAAWNIQDPSANRFVELTNTPEYNVPSEFDSAYDKALANVKTVKKTSFLNAMANLPHEDQKKLSNGEIRYYQEKSYKVGTVSNTLFHTSPKIMLVARNGTNVTTYEFDTEKGSIKRQLTNASVARGAEYFHNEVSQIEEFFPDKSKVEANNTLSALGNVSPLLKVIAWSTADSRRSPRDAEQASDQSKSNMFISPRANHIADSLVSALDLDNPAYKKQATVLTAAEYRIEQRKAASDFILNLIPFRSAIVNFRDGNIAEGIQDLQLDALGFVTAGFGAAAKTASVLSKTGSALSKAVKTSKIFGAAALGELNPLSGLGDLAIGAGKLAYKGGTNALQWGAAKSAQGVNKLIGATGSYDLLKAASKDYKAAAIGTAKAGGQSVDASAVFIDGKWYGFDPAMGRPYGSPLTDFRPDVVTHGGEVKAFTDTWLGKMIGSIVAPPAANPNFLRDYSAAVTTAKARDAAAYRLGYNTGKPDALYGYSSALNINDVKRLAVSQVHSPSELGSLGKRIDQLEALPMEFKSALQTAEAVNPDSFALGYKIGKPEGIRGLSDTLTTQQLGELIVANKANPEAAGRLLKHLEQKRIEVSIENYRVFKDEIVAAGGQAVPLQQGFYLSQVSQLSEGECAAIANLMAAAQKEGKQDTFLKNLYAAMVPPLSPNEMRALQLADPAKAALEQARAAKVTKFREDLNTVQLVLENHFHLGMQSRQVPYTTLISELANAKVSKTLLIQGPGHGITAGVKVGTDVNGNQVKTWFYFDPNFGQATFKSEASMRAALESTLNTGLSKQLLPSYGQNLALPEFKISVFDPVELDITTRSTRIDTTTLYRNEL